MVRISTLLDILAALVSLAGVAPLYPFLDGGARLLFPLALLAGLLRSRWPGLVLPTIPATLTALAVLVYYLPQVSRVSLVEPAVNVLVLLLCLRLVTERSGRNYLQLFVLAIFALAGSSLLSLELGYLFYLVVQVTLVTVGLVLLSFHGEDPELRLERRPLRQVLAVALLLPAASLVLMLGFFVILPRTEQPLWHFLNPPASAEVGFSDQVSPGHYAEMSATGDIAFRVAGSQLPMAQRYWRTIVLNALNGQTWVRETPPSGAVTKVVGDRRVELEFFVAPRQGRYMPTLDLPLALSEVRSRELGEGVYATHRTSDRQIRYRQTAVPDGVLMERGRIDRDFYLRPPTLVSPRVAAVAEEIAGEGGDVAARVAALEGFFLRQDLQYATSDLPEGEDPVDAFLFEKKRGYCEYFASAFAQLVRLSGVPARLVGGYYGGEYNPFGGYYSVAEATAHVWVEVLHEDGRWQRLDPTRLAANAAGDFLGARSRGPGLARRLADGIDYFWTQAVITYDFGRQWEAVKGVRDQLRGQTAPSATASEPRPSGAPLAWALVLAALAYGGLRLWRRGTSREERLLRKFLRRTAKRHGLAAIPDSVGLHELAEGLDDPQAREFAELYGGAIYRDRKLEEGEYRRLREIVREMRKGRLKAEG